MDNPVTQCMSFDTLSRSLSGSDSAATFRDGVRQDHESVWKAYLDGCSVVLNSFDRTLPADHPLRATTRALRSQLQHAFLVMYLTPAGSFAVRAHSDDQDVWLLQWAGCKKWRVYEPSADSRQLCYSDEQVGKHADATPSQLSKVALDHELTAGEILYIPRGHVHGASVPADARAPFSLHLTLTVPTCDFTHGRLLVAGLKRALRGTGGPASSGETLGPASPATLPAADGLFWRACDLPALSDGAGLAESIAKNLQALLAQPEAVPDLVRLGLHDLRSRIRRVNAAQDGARMAVPPSIALADRVRWLPGVRCVCHAGDSKAYFERADGGRMDLPIRPEHSALIGAVTEGGLDVRSLVARSGARDLLEALSVLHVLCDMGCFQRLGS